MFKSARLRLRTTFKKKLQETGDMNHRIKMVNNRVNLSVRRQCNLLAINRSSFYYKPSP